ncbi:GFA family protein [Halioxenophilus sp. WMMB6]|uniref:GFA family protein n=1 Tax=Halioxenophilus sp. WMMB6 TaxID=3073815 RepID=UPI00295E4532|nr:GFA family protein [Halioxenophilus sp. WMMB6]
MRGSCLCGRVQYQVAEFESNIANCFCSMCRKQSGSAFATYGSVKVENLEWLSGKEFIKTYRSSSIAERGFCNHCGSNLFYHVIADNHEVEIALGTLNDEPNVKPNANIYCASRPKWFESPTQLPEFSGGRE